MAGKARLGELLIQAGLIDELQLTRALGEQKQWGKRLGQMLLKLGFVEEADLLGVLAKQLGLSAVRLEGKRVDPEVLELIPAQLARKHRCLPLFVKRVGGIDELYLGMDDPSDLAAIDDLSFRTGRRIHPVLVGSFELSDALERFYGLPAVQDGKDGAFAEAPLEAGDTAPELAGLAEEAFIPFDEDTDPVAPSPASQEEPKPADPGGSPEKPREVSTRVILRAITELLIEKGVVGREELLERIQRRRS